MAYQKPSLFHYRVAQSAAWILATFVFRRRILRNEIKGKKGPYVVIANHQAALDFVNLIGATSRPMTFVISKSFFSTLPVKGIMEKMGVIPKQQFQTAVSDLKAMRSVIEAGQPLVIYPAGLMCEDGLSTPIPSATYKFLQWLGADVYVARATGSYFVMPKWKGGMHPGRTDMDIYRLFAKEELADMTEEQIKEKTDQALLFDAYREQENTLVKYHQTHCIEGLENVLYACPHCGKEYEMHAAKDTIRCAACGYEQTSDRYGFLHNRKGLGEEIRYVSDWSRLIHNRLKGRIQQGIDTTLSSAITIRMVDESKNKFVDVGTGRLHLDGERFLITGTIHGRPAELNIPIAGIPTLPFTPGKHLEVQHGSAIYRCVPEDRRLVMKFIQMVKIFYELKNAPVGAEIGG